MPQIEIRPVTAQDLPVLGEIDHGYKSNYVWQMDRTSDDGQVTIVFREIRLPRPVRVEYPRSVRVMMEEWGTQTTVLVGVIEGQPIGYVSISEAIAPTTAWVTDLAVDPLYRRQGIASAMLVAAQDFALHHQNRRMILEMQSKNYPAIRMAQKLGYDLCGYNDHYYTNQDIALFFAQYLR